MNVTLSIDKQLLKQARETARIMGKSLNQLIRDYLAQVTRQDDIEDEMEELRRLSGQGKRGVWRFNRDELHERT